MSKQLKYYLSTIADVDYGWNEEEESEIIHYVHHTGPVAKDFGLGLELAEFCISDNCENPAQIMEFFEANARDYTKDLVFHAPYNELIPHAIEPLVAKVAYDRYSQAYDMCEKYGCTKMIVHPNYIPTMYYESWFVPKQVEFWTKFLEEHPGKCIITLENVMEDHPSLIKDIVAKADNPRLRMCLDVGHANLHPVKPMDWIKECCEYISHMHIHNNNGPVTEGNASLGDKHRALGDGIMDMEALLRTADELCPEGLTAAVESYAIEDSCSWLKEHDFI